MTEALISLLLPVGIIVPMVALVWATLQPTRASVWSAVAALSLLPAAFLVLALVVWTMGR